MVNNINNKLVPVKMLCKTFSKTVCNFCVPFCGYFHFPYKKCVQLHFFTKFFQVTHQDIHLCFVPVFNQCFTHFHIPYYNYYKK